MKEFSLSSYRFFTSRIQSEMSPSLLFVTMPVAVFVNSNAEMASTTLGLSPTFALYA